jgi:RNA polymerase sigma-70 factor (ECF subfamily)
VETDRREDVLTKGILSSQEFDEIYDQYKTDIFYFICHLTHDRTEADDMFQEVWLRVIRHKPPQEKTQDLKLWLLTVVLNLHRDMLRKKRVRRLFFLSRKREESRDDGRLEVSAQSSYDPAYRSEQLALQRDIDIAIAKLPEKQRRIFVLKEMGGFQQAEISSILGIPLGTVKSLMHRAVKALQKELVSYNSKRGRVKCDVRILSVWSLRLRRGLLLTVI